jgi:flagellar protein FlaG
MLQRIDGPAPSVASAAEGVGASAPGRAPRVAAAAVLGSRTDPQATAEQVRAAVANANRHIRSYSQALEFEVDPDTDKIVIRLVDTQDRRVLRQVPSQEMLAIARALERMQSRLVRGEA